MLNHARNKRAYNATANRNRKEAENQNWELQYAAMESAYMQFERLGVPDGAGVDSVEIKCLDLNSSCNRSAYNRLS